MTQIGFGKKRKELFMHKSKSLGLTFRNGWIEGLTYYQELSLTISQLISFELASFSSRLFSSGDKDDYH